MSYFASGQIHTEKISTTSAMSTAGYIPVHCGFKPGKITVRNKTSGAILEWDEALGADGYAMKEVLSTATAGTMTRTYLSETLSGTNVTLTRPVTVLGEFPADGTNTQIASVRAALDAEAEDGAQGFALTWGYADLTDTASEDLYIEAVARTGNPSANDATKNDLGIDPRNP